MSTGYLILTAVLFGVLQYVSILVYRYHLNTVHDGYLYKISTLNAEIERVTKNYTDLLSLRQTTRNNGKPKIGQLTLVPDHMTDKTETYRQINGNDGYTYRTTLSNAVKLESGNHLIIRHHEELSRKNQWVNGKNSKLWCELPNTEYVYDNSFTRYWDEVIDHELWECVGKTKRQEIDPDIKKSNRVRIDSYLKNSDLGKIPE